MAATTSTMTMRLQCVVGSGRWLSSEYMYVICDRTMSQIQDTHTNVKTLISFSNVIKLCASRSECEMRVCVSAPGLMLALLCSNKPDEFIYYTHVLCRPTI